MKPIVTLVAATVIATAPGFALAAPPSSGSISPAHATGQPGLECEDEGAVIPGAQSGRDPGPGSPFQEDSVSGSHYAGEQAGINDKNTASSSQYDTACFGSDRPEGE